MPDAVSLQAVGVAAVPDAELAMTSQQGRALGHREVDDGAFRARSGRRRGRLPLRESPSLAPLKFAIDNYSQIMRCQRDIAQFPFRSPRSPRKSADDDRVDDCRCSAGHVRRLPAAPSRRRNRAAHRRVAGTAHAKGGQSSHVQHDGGPGDVLAKGSAGWPHHPLVSPRPGEIVVEKRHSSSFHDTDLHRRLADTGIDRLVIAGMQTEMCVDSACRGAVALGYRVVFVADGQRPGTRR